MNHHQPTGRRQPYDAWDAVPRDGPAVLVTDTDSFDRHQELRGGWIDPTTDEATIAEAIRTAVGEEAWRSDRWVIVDQVGLGSVMLAERLSVHGLARVAAALHGGER